MVINFSVLLSKRDMWIFEKQAKRFCENVSLHQYRGITQNENLVRIENS